MSLSNEEIIDRLKAMSFKKKKQDEIQIHKNKIAELTNRARSIKDLLKLKFGDWVCELNTNKIENNEEYIK